MPFNFDYILETGELGWARLSITVGETRIATPVSYDHDSLSELAELALEYVDGYTVREIPFVNEPGAMVCSFNRSGDTVHLTVYSEPNWICGRARTDRAHIIVEATQHHLDFAKNICAVLHAVWQATGVAAYRKVWNASDFPLVVYIRLRLLLDHSPVAAAIRDRSSRGEPTRDLEMALLNTPLTL